GDGTRGGGPDPGRRHDPGRRVVRGRLMDGYVLTIWVVRVLFLALLYVFLFGVARTLIRDLRAAAREPVTDLGRLVVLASPWGGPAPGPSAGAGAEPNAGPGAARSARG